MEIDRVKEDERRIVLKTDSGEAFSITYQTDYPTSADEYLVSFVQLMVYMYNTRLPFRRQGFHKRGMCIIISR